MRGVEQQPAAIVQMNQLETTGPLDVRHPAFDGGSRYADAPASRRFEHANRHEGVANLVCASKGERKGPVSLLWRVDDQAVIVALDGAHTCARAGVHQPRPMLGRDRRYDVTSLDGQSAR